VWGNDVLVPLIPVSPHRPHISVLACNVHPTMSYRYTGRVLPRVRHGPLKRSLAARRKVGHLGPFGRRRGNREALGVCCSVLTTVVKPMSEVIE